MKEKLERTIDTPGRALNALNNALAFITRGPSFVGLREARKILIRAYSEVFSEIKKLNETKDE